MMNAQSNLGPHAAIGGNNARQQFALDLFDALWERYRRRVEYVATYERVVAEHKAAFVNDHIAFRTFACQRPLTGISSISRIFEALDYRMAGCYHFPDKHLNAIHFQHPRSEFPKLFISELKVWELPEAVRTAVENVVASHRAPLDGKTLAALFDIEGPNAALLDAIVGQFHDLPWTTPEKETVASVNEASQYAAWVLVHGYNVNHFTSLINSHGTESLDDVEKTVAALQQAGVPMKDSIEGEPGSKLRQTATEAVRIDVDVLEGGQPQQMPWTYAYFELAQRGEITDPVSGKPTRFEGFLGPQATQLFEMTRIK